MGGVGAEVGWKWRQLYLNNNKKRKKEKNNNTKLKKKEILQCNPRKQTTQLKFFAIKKWAKDLNKDSSKENIQIINEHIKSWLTSLAIRKIQIKTTMRYYFTPIKMTNIKRQNNPYWRECGEIRILCISGRSVKCYNCCGKWYGDFFTKLKHILLGKE